MDKVKKKLAFGCMRLPMKDGRVDEPQFCRMIDRFLEEGFNYFYTKQGGRASDCIKCGKCEKICPQHLPVRELLVDVAKAFDNR